MTTIDVLQVQVPAFSVLYASVSHPHELHWHWGLFPPKFIWTLSSFIQDLEFFGLLPVKLTEVLYTYKL